jgi:cytochrome c-type biogenesis protein
VHLTLHPAVIPSYLSFIGGNLAVEVADQQASRTRLLLKTVFFVLGFSAIFVALGVAFSSFGLFPPHMLAAVYRVAGVIVVLFGINFVFDFWKALNLERRFHFHQRPRGLLGSALLGAAFGAGWTPCVGPILSAILFLAGTTETVTRGTALLATYALGLGTPFLLAAVFSATFVKWAQRLRGSMKLIKIGSGVFLMLLGVLLFFGGLARLNAIFFALAGKLDRWAQVSVAGSRLLFGLLFLVLGGLPAVKYVKSLQGVTGRNRLSIALLGSPVALVFLVAFATLSVLSFTGVLNVPALVVSWLRFQGV